MILARIHQRLCSSFIAFLLLCQVVTALPTASVALSLEGSSATEEGFQSPVSIFSLYTDPRTLQNIDPTILGGYIFVGAGILCIIFHFRMPKSIKERRKDREYKVSPVGQNLVRYGEEKVQVKEKQTCVPGDEINRIWIDALQKDKCIESKERNNGWSESRKGSGRPGVGGRSLTFPAPKPIRYPALPPLALTDPTHQGLGPLKPRETHNFGENPNYHDEGFQYSPAHPGTSVSTPPSPFSSRFYDSSIKKVKSHKRSWSTPTGAYQTFHASMGLEVQSSFVSTAHFPLPTLRPVTPPETMSTPGTPLLASHNEEEPLNSMTAYRYSRRYPQAPHDHSHNHNQPITLPGASPHTVLAASHTNTCTGIDDAPKGPTQVGSSVEEVDAQQHAGFQPVMIFEQGQSLTGQKWRRKVTVFRSEILERLKKEGLVNC